MQTKNQKEKLLEHKGAACILAVNNDKAFVRQYRKAIEENILELQAGILNIAEEPPEGALRELKEETGYKAGKIELIYEFYTSPGFSNEKVYLFKASELVYEGTDLDEDECLETIEVDRDEAKKMLETGKINDSKTIIGLLHWLNS